MKSDDEIAQRGVGRIPPPSSPAVSRVMKGNRGKDTTPELLMRAALRKAGIPGYRLHWKKAPGSPDIAYPGRRIAIFVHGCYWHSCPTCDIPIPQTNTEYWQTKFERNRARDERKKQRLEEMGWKVFVIWEHEVKEDPLACAQRVKDYIDAVSAKASR
ncbi:MAG: very short patch repair endonuclease [Candidatus Thorarchaeota archaeon]|nr:very short patch repair endonuclease [Candidatus Thorarchaeota archaeon]